MNVLKSDKGEFTLNGAFMLILVIGLVVFFTSIISIGVQKSKVDSIASDLTRYIEIRGKYDSSVTEELERLETAAGMDLTMTIDADYYSSSEQTIQFGDAFTITLTYPTSFGMGGLLSVPIELHGIGSGRSEQYWK